MTPDFIDTITEIERRSSSVNGNPAYAITFHTHGKLRTQSDASISYAIGNPEYRVGKRVGVWLTRSGEISYMAPEADNA